MPDYRDTGHRPHAVHTGEEPQNQWDRGPYGISVTLDTWGPQHDLFTTLYDQLQSNWGEAPSRSVDRVCGCGGLDHLHPGELSEVFSWQHTSGWCKLSEGERAYVESCFAGKTLNQVLEGLTFSFTVSGVARVFTHQYVRTRIGAAFMQHGGRDNDWRHRRWTMPETIYRACQEYDQMSGPADDDVVRGDLKTCVTDWDVISRYLGDAGEEGTEPGGPRSLCDAIEDHLMRGKRLYAALVDAGVPWQDARRVLPMGTQTYIHSIYNYLALQGVCNKRLEPAMDWEINAVAQLMVREVRKHCPPLIGKYLQSMSDKIGKDAFAGLESWTPSGKYEVPADKKDLHRTHRPEQAPFWILHPDSMTGGPVQWIPTNGVWPEELK